MSTASTQAEIKLLGSGTLVEYIEKLNKSNSQFLKDAKVQQKAFENLNKTGKNTENLFKGLATNSKDFYGGLTKLTRSSRNTVSFFKDTGSATITLQENLDKSTKGFRGLALASVGFRDEAKTLNKVLKGPAKDLADIADAGSNTERVFLVLDKVSRPLSRGFSSMADSVRLMGKGLQDAEKHVAMFSQTVVTTGAKSLQFFSDTFKDVAENLRSSSIFGRVFASNFEAVAGALEKSSEKAKDFSKQISPEQFALVDKAGNNLAKTFKTVGDGLDKAARGVRIADFVGDISRAINSTKDFSTVLKEDLTEGFAEFAHQGQRVLPLLQAFLTKNQLVAMAASALGFIFKNDLLKAIGSFAGKLTALSIATAGMQQLTLAAGDAYLKMQGLGDAFSVMQNLGIDTTAASIAFQFGLVGEKLLLSAEAAKEFGKAAITAFAQLEDAAAFVTTLQVGASIQLDGYAAGVESISAAMSKLVSGPLKNTISSLEATNALYNALSAGVGVARDGTLQLSETNEFLAASLKLSAGTGANAAETLELLAKTSKVYSISNTDAAKTAAQLYQIVEQGITTFPQLTAGLGRTLSVARSTGVALDEAAGSIAALTKVTSTDQALTGLESLLRSVAGQGAQAQKAISELGIRFDINTIKTKGLTEALKDLYDATGGNASAIKEIIPDSLGYRTALQLMTVASKDAAETTEKVKNAGEELLDTVFENRQQSTIKQFSLVMNGFNEVLIDFGQRALPMLNPAIGFLENLLGVLQNLPEPIKNAIGGLVIFQSLFSNITGALVGFLLQAAQIGAMFIGFNLFMKLISGRLGDLIKSLKIVNEGSIDWGRSLLILLGYNKNLSSEVLLANKSLKQQAVIKDMLSKQGLNYTDDISSAEGLNTVIEKLNDEITKLNTLHLTNTERGLIDFDKEINNLEGLKEALSVTRSKIDEFRNNGDATKGLSSLTIEATLGELTALEKRLAQIAANPATFERQVAEFEKIKNEIEKLRNIEKSREAGIFTKFAQNIDNGVKAARTNLEKGATFISQSVEKMIKEVGLVADTFSPEARQAIENILKDSDLKVQQKVDKLNYIFELLFEGQDEKTRQKLEIIKATLVSGVNQLDKDSDSAFNRTRQALDSKFKDLFGENYSEQANKSLGSLADTVKGLALGIVDGAETGISDLSYVFGTALSDTEVTSKEKITAIKEAFSTLVAERSGQAKEQLTKLKDAFVTGLTEVEIKTSEKVAEIRAKFTTFIEETTVDDVVSKLEVLKTEFSSNLENLELTAREKIDFVNQSFDSFIDANVSQDVKVKLEKLRDEFVTNLGGVSETVKAKTEQVKESFSNFINNDQVETSMVRVRDSFTNGFGALPEIVVESLNDVNEKLNGGFEKLGLDTKGQVDYINATFDTMIANSAPTVAENLDKLRTSIITRLESIEATVETVLTNVDVEPQVEKVNTALATIADTRTQEVVGKNVNSIKDEIKQRGEPIVQAAKSVADRTDAQFKRVGRAANSAGNLLSNFIPGFSIFQSVARDAGDLLDNLGFGTEQFAKSLKKTEVAQASSTALMVVDSKVKAKSTAVTAANATAITVATKATATHAAVTGGATAATGAFSIKTAILTKLMGIKTAVALKSAGAMVVLKSALATAGGMAAFAATGFSSMFIFLAPLALKIAAVVAILAVLAKILGALFPAFNRLISANARAEERLSKFTAQVERANKELAKLNQEISRARATETIDISLELTDAEKLAEKRKEILKELTPDEKEYAQGFGGFIIDVGEFFAQQISNNFVKAIPNVALIGTKMLKSILPKGVMTEQLDEFGFSIEKKFMEVDNKIREKANQVRKKWQNWLEKDLRKQVDAISEANKVLSGTLDDAIGEYEKGQAASVKGQEILQKALSENRALTANEMRELSTAEQDYYEIVRKQTSDRIAGLQAQLEQNKRMSPELKALIQEEIDQLSERNSKIEEANLRMIEYRDTIQSLLVTVENNAVSTGVDNLSASLEKLYTELREGDNYATQSDAQKRFQDLIGFDVNAVSFAELEDGFSGPSGIIQTVEASFEDLGLAFETASDRMKTRAVLATTSSLSQVIEDLNDPDKQVTYDDLKTNIFNTLDAIGEGYREEGDRVAAIIRTVNQTINVDGREVLLREILNPNDQEGLISTITSTLQAGADRAIDINNQKIAEITEQERAGTLSTAEALSQRIALEEENAQTLLDNKKAQYDTLVEAGMGSYRATEDLAREITRLEIEQSNTRIANAKREIEARDVITLENNGAKIAQLNAQMQTRQITEVEGLREIADLEESNNELILKQKQDLLARMASENRQGSEEYKRLQNEIATLEVTNDAKRIENRRKILEAELNLVRAQKDNEFKILEQAISKEAGLMGFREKAMQLEQQALGANKELSESIRNLEVTAAQNKLKFSGDILEKAEAELAIAQDRLKALDQEQEFETSNLELQQTIQKMALEREMSQARLNKLQLENQKILANSRLLKADELGMTKEEREALEIQIDGLDQQIDLAVLQQTQLERQSQTQDEINQKQSESLKLRQDAARQTSAADVELAKLELVNAGYQKQKEILQNNTKLAELQSNARILALKEEETLLNKQTEILQKQLEITKQTADVSQRMYSLAQQGAISGFRQRRIEKEAAEARRKNLEQTQEIERVNLEISQFMRDLALERRKIELEIAEVKQVAAIAEARAEVARMEADPRVSEEQREAARLGLAAQEQGLAGIQQERQLLAFEEGMNKVINNLEQNQQEASQRAERREADMSVANLSRGRSARSRVGRSALADARELDESFSEEASNLVNSFRSLNTTLETEQRQINMNLAGGALSQGISRSIVSNQIETASNPGSSDNQLSSNKIEGTVNVVLEVKGEGAANLNQADLQKAASDSLYEGLNKLFDYHINRNR